MTQIITSPNQIKPVNGQFNYGQVPKGHYEKIIWSSHPIRTFWHQERFLEMEALMDTNESSVILDYGCASGSFLGSLHVPYGRAYGVDVAEAQVQLANEKYGSSKLSFVAGDHLSMRFEENSFDFIVTSELIEHVGRPTGIQMLRIFRSLLKPTGKLILSTPNYRSLWPALEFFVNKFSEVDYEHQHINKLHIGTCHDMLVDSGFKVDKMLTIFVTAPFFAGISLPFARSLHRLEKKLTPNLGSLILLSATKS